MELYTKSSHSLPFRFPAAYRKPVLLGAILFFYLVSGVSYLRTQSVTSDENSFYLYAKRWARGNPLRTDPATDDSKTPVVALNLAPRAVFQLFHPGMHKTDNGEDDLITGRYITLFFSLLSFWIVFAWTRELAGENAALFAVFLLALEPTFLANNALVTTDGYSCFFLLATLYSLWKLLRFRNRCWLVCFSVAIAAAQLVKQSLVHLYVVTALLIIAEFVWGRRPRGGLLLWSLFFFLFLQWLVINLGYYFFQTNLPAGDYHFLSHFFQTVQRHLPRRLTIPFPAPFIQAFDMTKYVDETGSGVGSVTILGQRSNVSGFWYYYLVSLFFKAPVAFMILAVIATLRLWRKKNIDTQSVRCLLFPLIYFLVFFSFFYRVQVGVRHIVFLVPAVCIFLASVLMNRMERGDRWLLPALSVWLLTSNGWYWQHQYSYTNEFVTDKTFAYKLVGSNNLDFRQGRYWGDRYLRRHSEVQWGGGPPRPGRFLISVQDYMDIHNEHKWDWLSARRPYGQVGFSNLLVQVTAEDLKP